ncbi:MAG: hypothetical protein LBT76_03440, partial [Tannerella sp.]|nr:hypothetical protein [Tannerella sp.]
MKRDADFGKDTTRPLKKSCDKFAGGGILAVPSPMTVNTHRSSAKSSRFTLSPFGETSKNHFSCFLRLEKPSEIVFHAFSVWRNLQKSFFTLSPFGETFRNRFSCFLRLEKPSKTVFHAFSVWRNLQKPFFTLSPFGETSRNR